jgi:hypothetical protein
MSAVYDPAFDRIDVAVRGLVNLRGNGKWPLLARYGITRKEHDAVMRDALLEIETIKTEDGIFELLRMCPFLLPAAIEMLREYQEQYAVSRRYHYRGAA